MPVVHRRRRVTASAPIGVSRVEVGREEEELVLQVLRSGWLAQGPMVERLEESFCDLTRARHAVAVSSGTVALVAALQALEIAPGDEVVTSPFTFAATLTAILNAGATAVFADIDDDFNVPAHALAAAMGTQTRVVMPVHLYGLPADMSTIEEVARSASVAIVEDAAQAHGAAVAGRPVGTWGLGCFSLYATKNVTTGEGGVVTTDDDALADRLRLLRNQGMRGRYEYEALGHNYRMTDLQAAVGIPQMERLERITASRRANAAVLTEGLEDVPGIRLPGTPPGRTHVWHQFTIRVTPDAVLTRDELSDRLAGCGISTAVYYPRAVYDYPCYRAHPRVRVTPTPNADEAARTVLSLPVHQGLTPSELERTVDCVRGLLGA